MRTRARRRALISLSAATLVLATSCAGVSNATVGAPTVTVTATPPPVTVTLVVEVTGAGTTVTVTTPQTAPLAAFRDGQHIVGRDILPGTYRSSASSDVCYWERQNSSGELLDNGFGTLATIRSSDYSFQSNRCGTWSRVG